MNKLIVFTTFTYMDNFIPAIVVIGIIIYRIYNEYQKEQEKAAKRRPIIPVPAAPAKQPDFAAEARGKYTEEREPLSREFANPAVKWFEDVPSEVQRVRTAKQLKVTNAPKLVELEDLEPMPAFDLRNAIIQSAILERPFK